LFKLFKHLQQPSSPVSACGSSGDVAWTTSAMIRWAFRQELEEPINGFENQVFEITITSA